MGILLPVAYLVQYCACLMRYSGFLIKYCCGQVVFLLLFVAYFVIGVVALAVDAEAMDAACATDSWIW